MRRKNIKPEKEMNKNQINKNIAIAIGLLGDTRTDYYGNEKLRNLSAILSRK
jgi:hypothetical protein